MVYLLLLMHPHGHITTQSPYFALQSCEPFNEHNIDFSNCTRWVRAWSIVQRISTAFTAPCPAGSAFAPSQSPTSCLFQTAIQWESDSVEPFQTGFFHLLFIYMSSIPCHGFIPHFFLVHCLDVPQSTYSFILLRTSWLTSSVGNYGQNCYKHPCVSFCVNINFQLLCVKSKEHDCWESVCSCKKLPDCLWKWWYHFCIPTSIKREVLLLHTLTCVWYLQCFGFW